MLLDPWPHYRAIRDTGPAVYLEHYDHCAVGRFTDVRDLGSQVSTLECGEPVWEPHNTTRGLARLPMEIS
ncbi:MAG: hypothetical protein ACRD02_14890 [Acidimicrobiia bacterium]